MRPRSAAISTILLVLSPTISAQLPYNPTRLLLSPDRSQVYQLSPESSQVSLSYLDFSNQVDSSSAATAIYQNLPFAIGNQSFIPVADNEGITVLTGDCQDTTQEAELWRFTPSRDGKNGTWQMLQVSSSDNSLTANYLSAGFSFSPTASTQDVSVYVFGGMCPEGESDSSNWISQASYSNTMLTLTTTNDQAPYQLSVTGARAPPVAEAGLTVTPLLAILSNSSGSVSQQQNFVLLGGHTQQAFINMSQVALFSLPEASWAFVGVNQPTGSTGELVKRDADTVEPRSGHTAILTEDGTKIVVFGGWVGDVTNPATPQLAILQPGQGYGGSTSWQWTIPTQNADPFSSGQGLYGHGAVMLPGNVMMVAGGNSIGAPKTKRSVQNYMFYNVSSSTWSSNYKNLHQSGSTSHSSGLKSSQKAGLGAGLGLGLFTLIVVAVLWLLYRKKMHEKRTERERRLRELAFGSERYNSSSRVPSQIGRQVSQTEMRSASWGSRQERQIENPGFMFPWMSSGSQRQNNPPEVEDDVQGVERTGVEMDVPSPTRGLRKSLSTRGAATYGNYNPVLHSGPGSVFRIDEVEEEGSIRSVHLRPTAGSRLSDPFKDPPVLEAIDPAAERRREVQGWVEDWQSAAENMNLSRQPSHARTYSNLSQAHSQAHSGSQSSSYQTGRESPDKSDRTGSNLSERSNYSVQRSLAGTVSRQISQRSVSAGYALFAGAAAAMSRLGGSNRDTALERTASKRSISMNAAQPRRTVSGSRRPINGEVRSLVRENSPTKGDLHPSGSSEPPIKDYKNYDRTSSLTSQKTKTGILGSVKRVFTGTSHVDVQAQVEQYEEKDEEGNIVPEMAERENPGAAFWRGKKGAKDWDEVEDGLPSPSTAKRKSIRDSINTEDYDAEDWDVETAVQKRLVQVMFTVPKEKLRVVNADSLSILSRSDIDEREREEARAGLGRMDSVSEDHEAADGEDQHGGTGKGKERDTTDGRQ